MTRNWTRLGEELKSARAGRGLEQQQVAAKVGVKRGAIRNIERGAIAKVTPTVLAYARLVGWTEDSVERVLAGEAPRISEPEPRQPEPRQQPEAEPESECDPIAGFSPRVRQSLQEGPLIDTRVAELTTPTGRVRATIVIRGEDGTPAEDLLAALRSLRIDVTIEN
ncbi:helix-turn-helix transcriptional regulator [Actinacidiphila sp. ITFR-21]|uniref:helix-turn-helix transcriptional regulator n=1 Tax=Actinacidiphila sp. ITFR-21 TaxID=3075199 RepID=UPI00288AB489|nr:helix-turn-helix transcriptional regulator [Streptomyces sp. ITFR-21]WNI20313.1 helix-turn-helix transcriptional regulator [Streptomyces sp. ITFR-21]